MAKPATSGPVVSRAGRRWSRAGISGIGRAAAIAFAREGADVAINHLPDEAEDAQEVIDLIMRDGRTGLSIPGDLRDQAFCRRLVDETVKGLGGLDILVMNAGRQQTRDSILDVSNEDFDATMKTNIYAPLWIIKAAMPHLRPGSVIVVYNIGASLRSIARPLRLRADESGDDELCEVASEATREQRNSGERGRSRADMDAVASQWRSDDEKTE